ncbi:hypothetical protein R1sor_022049 [Riccia sorocarpa]|uniref:PRISE-like Rossmann-fold domain-containing protein n=1 Tax=Riccia sorocarpa TaxID=122646 RepID=A0ABD3GIR9_9MARC
MCLHKLVVIDRYCNSLLRLNIGRFIGSEDKKMTDDSKITRRALICGATGIVGKYLVDSLSSPECPTGPWTVYALARRPAKAAEVCFKSGTAFTYIQANLLDKDDVQSKLEPLTDVTHLFWVTWVQGKDEDENCRLNGQMFTNVLDVLLPRAKKLEHIVLQTGAKQYVGPFGAGLEPHESPFREEYPRLPGKNFYHTLEDILFERVKGTNITYSIHRPGNILGFSAGNLMSLVGTLGVYAAICKHEGLPFVYPGNSLTWNHLNDASSADLIAEQEIWAATTPEAKNQAFNIVNGDVFRWRKVWPIVAEQLGVEPAPYPGKGFNLTERFGSKDEVWDRIVKEKGLVETKLKDVGHFWFLDYVLNTPFEALESMNKSRKFGFHGFRDTEESIQAVVHELIEAKIIPTFHERYMLRSTNGK